MPPRSKKPRRFLLTVVSASALLPGCAQEHEYGAGDEADEGEGKTDAAAVGLVAAPEGGRPIPAYDAGRWQGTVIHPDAGQPVGITVSIDAGLPPRSADAGLRDAGPGDASGDAANDASHDAGPLEAAVPQADGGSRDAGCWYDASLINGIIVAPADASCIPFIGVVLRNGQDID